MLEETGICYEVDRLAVIHENFFTESDGLLAQKVCHEVAFYFLMRPSEGEDLLFKTGVTSFGAQEWVRWVPIADLGQYKHYPLFLKEYLESMPREVVHLLSDERKQKK
ncbi:hypothetical protein ABB02_01227 [Clostridiaceae bacterium JG1575]|nr:hypothetical protein ABB02_01227 [Clostridiaceae bacterium JG1575]